MSRIGQTFTALKAHNKKALIPFITAGDPGKGVGVGVRWYSIVGPMRLDIAQGLDLQGEPWRIHFTIGTPLL